MVYGKKKVLPGDKIATIEEFASGRGSSVLGESVISTLVGETSPDMDTRVITVNTTKQGLGLIPQEGDYIVGTVQSAQPSIVQVKIEAINDENSTKNFTGMLSLRDDRRRRTTSPIKSGDTLRARVASTKNSIFHLSIDGPGCGVLYTICSICGGDVFAIGPDRVKCRECGWVDERLLSEDFIKSSRSQR